MRPGSSVGWVWIAPIRRVTAPTNNTNAAKFKSMILNRNRPAPKRSIGVGLGIVPATNVIKMGREQRNNVYVAPKISNPRVALRSTGSWVKNWAVSEVMFHIMIKTTEVKSPTKFLETTGCHPNLGCNARNILWAKMIFTANKTTTLLKMPD